MTYAPAYIQEFADTRETSIEIALAIFELAADGDEQRMWEAPSDEETNQVMARAWELADPDDTDLN